MSDKNEDALRMESAEDEITEKEKEVVEDDGRTVGNLKGEIVQDRMPFFIFTENVFKPYHSAPPDTSLPNHSAMLTALHRQNAPTARIGYR